MLALHGQTRLFRGSARSIQSALYLAGPRTSIPQRCLTLRLPTRAPRRLSSNNTKPGPATLLAKQRLNRPVSPYLTVFRQKITGTVSIATRITGIILSSGIYLYASAYALSPITGWDTSPSTVVEKFSELGPGTKGAVKILVAWPFLFHCLNGVRHLVWDTGVGLNNRAVVRSGWGVVGGSVVGGVVLGLYRPRKGEE
ncbi:succinate:quinone oxidoreductase subunit C [Aspergillus stella-maris]|uniref:succinate:quinone oxidoreductase subunit C n=1 Tax=Aspergillus stella-maris TaxID=1810926 RepID=UPI003CCCC7E6